MMWVVFHWMPFNPLQMEVKMIRRKKKNELHALFDGPFKQFIEKH